MAPVVVTGAGGQLGRAVVARLSASDEDTVALTHDKLDIVDAAEVREMIVGLGPSAVINCAAFTAVDACETHGGLARAVNAEGVGNLVLACDSVGAYLCEVSTDYVFDGSKPEPYVETDRPNPCSEYGRSKLAGELLVGPSHGIARTAWLFGDGGPNTIETALSRASSGHRLRFVTDQVGTPSYAADVAEVLVRMCSERIPGILHVTNSGETSWFGLIADALAAAGLPRSLVEPITTAELDPPRAAPRPANSRLDGPRRRARGIANLPHYTDALDRYMRARRS